LERRRVRVTGTVQGVGFRPFVYRHARALGLGGFVRNDSQGVLIEVEGPAEVIATLCNVLVEAPPPLARIASIDTELIAPRGSVVDFVIEATHDDGSPDVPVSVDSATCAECLREVDDRANRRFGYPFTNCTNCGPRYTIVRSVPYDRAATTMAGFTMCSRCQAEYDDPANRRFHAQPNACDHCGPHLSYHEPTGEVRAKGEDALGAAVADLCDGRILAIKGIGGYHLAVDAANEAAVAQLRRRKARDDKPFAVMVADLDTAASLCVLDADAREALSSPRRPIVLAPRQPGAPVASGVAPGLFELGLLLAYSPLHHLLLAGIGRPLVMTSGNLSDDPIAHVDQDAFERIGPLVDAVLTHDRAIHIRCDDSVARSTSRGLQLLRRSRGYAPEPFELSTPARRQVLAVGAELKNTVSVLKGTTLVTSHHIGDLEHLATYQSFLQATGHLCSLFGVHPEVLAHDLHPEYLSTKWAQDQDLALFAVQHHHAHIAACLSEHQHRGRVLGLAFDGLGMGSDGTLWGGEFLAADFFGFERVGHLATVVMPGGTRAIKEPWRMALAWTASGLGSDAAAQVGERLEPRWPAVLDLIEKRSGPVTSSMGRLFDAFGALLGIRSVVTYEGQAAIELEALAARASTTPLLAPLDVRANVLDPAPLLASVLSEQAAGADPAGLALGIHRQIARGAVELAQRLCEERGLDTVALSGGVFQNALFSALVEDGCREAGLSVLVHRLIPPNDGGISVGQAVLAAFAESVGD
jgi:hydrogenase maturation protein HypF